MKKLHFLAIALLLLALSSCKLDGESYRKFYGRVDIDSLIIQESAFLGDTVFIHAKAGAPNGCWSDLSLFFNRYNDTLYYINAAGMFESHNNICPDIYLIKDSTFRFIPDTTGQFIFKSESEFRAVKYDTLLVIPKPVS